MFVFSLWGGVGGEENVCVCVGESVRINNSFTVLRRIVLVSIVVRGLRNISRIVVHAGAQGPSEFITTLLSSRSATGLFLCFYVIRIGTS